MRAVTRKLWDLGGSRVRRWLIIEGPEKQTSQERLVLPVTSKVDPKGLLKEWGKNLSPESSLKSPSLRVNFVLHMVQSWPVRGNWNRENVFMIPVVYCRRLKAFICCMRVEALVVLLFSLRLYLTVAPSASRTLNISWIRTGKCVSEGEKGRREQSL